MAQRKVVPIEEGHSGQELSKKPWERVTNVRIQPAEAWSPWGENKTPRRYKNEDSPITEMMADQVLAHRQAIEAIVTGQDPRFLLIVGPCSIHSAPAALEYAEGLKVIADEVNDRIMIVMRSYFEKPRTTVGWRGLAYDPVLDGEYRGSIGIPLLRMVLRGIVGLGLPIATEILDQFLANCYDEFPSWVAVGARSTETSAYRHMSSGSSAPVGFKNGTEGTYHSIKIAVDAIITAREKHEFHGVDLDGRSTVLLGTGNPYAHLVLRGGEKQPNFDSESIEYASWLLRGQNKRLRELLEKDDVETGILIDCSHGNSQKDPTRQAEALQAALAYHKQGKLVRGAMIESNLLPGSQTFIPGKTDPKKLQHGVSITDACIGWDETKQLIRAVYRELA